MHFRRYLLGLFVGWSVAVIVVLAGLGVLGANWEGVRMVVGLVSVGFLVTVSLFLPSSLVARRDGKRVPNRLFPVVGLVCGVAACLILTWWLEGFEYGLRPLFGDSVTWTWIAGLGLGGLAMGWKWASTDETA